MESDIDTLGLFEARYTAFLATIVHLRPRLHRYCARMSRSLSDGEDIMQEALFEAYRKLDSFDDSRALSPWLFRIPHNRCIDFLRRRDVRHKAEAAAAEPETITPIDPPGPSLDRAVERLVVNLPPKERACVLLKDVLDYSLEEIAELVDSTVGGVKAALNRGRAKLATLRDDAPAAKAAASPQTLELLRLYVERFNKRDWDGVRKLTSADARLRVADCFAGRLADSPYFVEYERPIVPWRMVLGEVDGETVVIVLREDIAVPAPFSFVRVDAANGVTATIDFYFDFVSPYSYLASTVLPRLAAGHGTTIGYRPMTLIELMRQVGNRPTTIECQNKGVYVTADVRRWAKRYQVAFAANPAWPRIDFAELGRGALVATDEGRGADYVAAVFRAVWADAADLSQRQTLVDALARAELDGDRLLRRAALP